MIYKTIKCFIDKQLLMYTLYIKKIVVLKSNID